MGKRQAGRQRQRRSNVVLDVLLLGVCGVLGWFLLGAAMERANVKSDIRIVEREAHALYDAFQSFHERNQGYPGDYSGRVFDPATLDPLRKRGYYRGFIQNRLVDRSIDAYASPDDRGPNQEFWIEMTLARDPRIRFLIARSDDAPLGGGQWREGVFIFRGHGRLEEL